MTAPWFQVDGLQAGYGRAQVLAGVSIAAERGQVVAIVGPNGAGKSTLLNALMGVLPARGRIVFDGEALQDLPLEVRVERGIALVPETRALFGSMTVSDNLLLGGYRRRHDGRAALASRIAGIHALFPRLSDRHDQLAATLSGGERQMLAIGRALMGEPRLLLLDEPSLGLAPLVASQIFEIIGRLRDRGTSVLLVEQNVRAALAVADTAYVLEMGAIVLAGRGSDLATDARVVDSYLGRERA